MIRTSSEVLRDTLADGIAVAPGYEGIHEAIATTIADIVGREAKPEPVIHVVRGLQVHGEMLPGNCPGTFRVRLQHHRLFRSQYRPLAE